MTMLDVTTSTNDDARRMAAEGAPHGAAVFAREQTAGRGQRGNTWESEAGSNATFSVVLRPSTVTANRQFGISQVVALAVVDTLAEYGIEACVKWPNDVYVGDLKICGILITHSLSGSDIVYTIAGIGINVNQRSFLSDAPNPVSMWQLTGIEYDPVEIARRVTRRIADDVAALPAGDHDERYRTHLWRGEGYWPYRDAATGECFDARITAISPTGILTLTPRTGTPRHYAFKEVQAIL